MVRYLVMTIAAQASAPPAPPPPPTLCDPFFLYFDAGSATVTAESQRMIGNIASVKDLMRSPIRVIGFADAPGSERYNLALSLKRAEAVKRALISKGVPAASILVGARGEASLLVETDAPEAQNRRVQVSDC